MNSTNILLGAGIGAAVAYMLDPVSGGRRRALVRDQVVRASRKTRDGMDAAARDIANRSKGIAASTRGRFADEDVDDTRLVERVRARLGRLCSHPRAIDVFATSGSVTLRGPILEREVNHLLDGVASIRGVHGVINELEPHSTPEGVPALQGAGNIAESRLDIMQRNWAPATRVLVAAAGLAATGAYFAAQGRR